MTPAEIREVQCVVSHVLTHLGCQDVRVTLRHVLPEVAVRVTWNHRRLGTGGFVITGFEYRAADAVVRSALLEWAADAVERSVADGG